MQQLFKKLPVAIATGVIALTLPGVANAFTMSPTPGAYDEGLYGDLSDDGLTPTDLGSLMPGLNNLKATFFKDADGNSLDYFTFTIDEGSALDAIILNSWGAEHTFEDIGFVAIVEGSVFDYDLATSPPEARATGLLGWSHLRRTQVGTPKILEEMAVSDMDVLDVAYFQEELDQDPYAGLGLDPMDKATLEGSLLALAGKWEAGAMGFDLPLGPGTYSMWLRQGSDVEISVDMDFIAVAGPENPAVSVPEPTGVLGTAVAFGLAALAGKKRKRS